MKIWLYIGFGLTALWLQLTLAPLLSVFGYKPNIALMILLLLGFRWRDEWLFLFGAVLGLMMDVFSHGVLGLYGISFFSAAFLSRYTGESIYENNLLISMGVISALSFGHGFVAVSLFESFYPEIPWWEWMFFKELPLAFIHGLYTPLLFLPLVWLEKRLKLTELLGIAL